MFAVRERLVRCMEFAAENVTDHVMMALLAAGVHNWSSSTSPSMVRSALVWSDDGGLVDLPRLTDCLVALGPPTYGRLRWVGDDIVLYIGLLSAPSPHADHLLNDLHAPSNNRAFSARRPVPIFGGPPVGPSARRHLPHAGARWSTDGHGAYPRGRRAAIVALLVLSRQDGVLAVMSAWALARLFAALADQPFDQGVARAP